MNFAQRLGMLCLILISAAYVYFSFFNKDGFNFNLNFNRPSDVPEGELVYNPRWQHENEEIEKAPKNEIRNIKIFVTDSNGNLRSVTRKCELAKEKSCLRFAIQELINSPTSWEKSKGLSSEIPSSTKIISIREGDSNIFVDLSSDFESGGGAESLYIRIHQLIKTIIANTNKPAYLYINGKQADVIGGEGIMIKQPLNERSLDE